MKVKINFFHQTIIIQLVVWEAWNIKREQIWKNLNPNQDSQLTSAKNKPEINQIHFYQTYRNIVKKVHLTTLYKLEPSHLTLVHLKVQVVLNVISLLFRGARLTIQRLKNQRKVADKHCFNTIFRRNLEAEEETSTMKML